MLEKLSQIVWLKDFYGPLLTEKQRAILSLYYEDDFSLSEIAEEMNISRQAVYDLVKRAEHQLWQYETKLGLVEKFQHTRRRLEEAQNLLDAYAADDAAIHNVLMILREITDSL
ncbi:RNA polymerase sigma factor, region 3/4 [Syntrophomonas zehnderi OL-4]|uniref:UPF0122 protein 1967 n=1 Tax=Syntrophomonas zehnderi OL-4 TaxID=690567 RepID=A0A0E4GEB1_9FIRM|nr:putative DNA-binding protein [Syntrophomonas zehnderi]CFX82687.1 RNA polymerase sigma factor, region 3/4 [Syntrophomonas zehnderi OL-4]